MVVAVVGRQCSAAAAAVVVVVVVGIQCLGWHLIVCSSWLVAVEGVGFPQLQLVRKIHDLII